MRVGPNLVGLIALVFSLFHTQIHAQVQCYTSPQAGSSPQMLSCIESAPDGPMTVKLYLHLIRNSDGTEGPTNDHVKRILSVLDESFNTHQIYFSLACINEINNTAFYEMPEASAILLASSYAQPDGINLFVRYANFQGQGGGLAENIPGNSAIVTIGNAERDYVVSHEIGHCMGLYHTFKGGPNTIETGNRELVNGSNCCTAGDFVCDTPADAPINQEGTYGAVSDGQGGCSWVTPPTPLDPTGQSYSTTDPANIMAYYSACPEEHFSVKQGIRMRHFLSTEPMLLATREDEASIVTDAHWTSDRTFDSDIRIYPGAELKISGATLHMAPGRKIIVEKGAVLNLKSGAKITVAEGVGCNPFGKFWQGIELRCGSTGDYPAYVLMYSATIERAENALYYTNQTASASYGMIAASLSTFVNNKNSIAFISGGQQFNTINSLFANNFARTNYIIDNNYPVGETFDGFVTLSSVNHSRFQGCTFSNQKYNEMIGSSLNQAIWAYQSKVTVKDRCNYGFPGENCPPDQYTPSYISGFTTALRLTGGHGSSVVGTNFDKISSLATKIDASNSFVFRKNKVNFNSSVANPASGRYGLFVENSTGHQINQNEFVVTLPESGKDAGVLVFNSGTEPHVISNNAFAACRTGIQTGGINYNPDNPNIGLQFLCNTFFNQMPVLNGVLGPFDLLFDGPVARIQGAQASPAGNVFSYNTSPVGSDIRNNAFFLNPVTYYFKTNTPFNEPINIVGVDKIATSNDPQCESPVNEENPNQLLLLYNSIKNTLDSAGAIYHGLIDGGNSSELVSRISQANATNAANLTSELWSITPYLSVQALKAIYDRSDIWNETARYDLLLANPDALAVPALRNWISESPSALPSAQQATLLTTNLPVTPRTEMESNIATHTSQMYQVINQALSLLYQQDSVDNSQAILTWLNRKHSFGASIEKAEVYLQSGNYAQALDILNDLPATLSLTKEEEQIRENYVAYWETLKAASEDGRSYFELTQSELSNMIELAEMGDAGNLAREFLLMYYGISIGEGALAADEHREMPVQHRNSIATNRNLQVKKLEAYPNPNQGRFTLAYPRLAEGAQAYLQVQSIMGAACTVLQVPANTGQMEADLSQLPEGLYWITLYKDGLPEQTTKIVIQH